MATEKRVSDQGTVFDAVLIRDFLRAALSHNAVIDRVDDLLFEHIAEGRYDLTVIARKLRPIINEVLRTATVEDWSSVADILIAHAREALEGLDETPGVSPRNDEKQRALRYLDPGELREKLAEIYSRDRVSFIAARRARWIIRRISRLTGIPSGQIRADMEADVQAIDAAKSAEVDPRVSITRSDLITSYFRSGEPLAIIATVSYHQGGWRISYYDRPRHVSHEKECDTREEAERIALRHANKMVAERQSDSLGDRVEADRADAGTDQESTERPASTAASEVISDAADPPISVARLILRQALEKGGTVHIQDTEENEYLGRVAAFDSEKVSLQNHWSGKQGEIWLDDIESIEEVDDFVRQLTSEDIFTLELLRAEPWAKHLSRRTVAAILLGSNAGCAPPQIAAMLVVKEPEVKRVIAAFNQHGLDSLYFPR